MQPRVPKQRDTTDEFHARRQPMARRLKMCALVDLFMLLLTEENLVVAVILPQKQLLRQHCRNT